MKTTLGKHNKLTELWSTLLNQKGANDLPLGYIIWNRDSRKSRKHGHQSEQGLANVPFLFKRQERRYKEEQLDSVHLLKPSLDFSWLFWSLLEWRWLLSCSWGSFPRGGSCTSWTLLVAPRPSTLKRSNEFLGRLGRRNWAWSPPSPSLWAHTPLRPSLPGVYGRRSCCCGGGLLCSSTNDDLVCKAVLILGLGNPLNWRSKSSPI